MRNEIKKINSIIMLIAFIFAFSLLGVFVSSAIFSDKKSSSTKINFQTIQLDDLTTSTSRAKLDLTRINKYVLGKNIDFAKSETSPNIYVRIALKFSTESESIVAKDIMKYQTITIADAPMGYEWVQWGEYYYLMDSTEPSNLKALTTTDTFTFLEQGSLIVPQQIIGNYNPSVPVYFTINMESIASNGVTTPTIAGTLNLFPNTPKTTHTIIIKNNAGTTLHTYNSQSYGTDIPLQSGDVLEDGTGTAFEFNTKQDGTGATVPFTEVGTTYYLNNISQDLVLYQKQKLNTYKVSYSTGANGIEINSISDQTKTHGINLILSDFVYARTGYTQTGWSTTDGGAKEYNLGDVYSLNSNLLLYPFWKVNSYAITLISGTGTQISISPSGTSQDYQTNITVTVEKLTGYNQGTIVIDVYKTNDSTTKLTLNNGKFVMPAFDVTISTTPLALNTYTVNATVSGGNGTIDQAQTSTSVIHGQTATITVNPSTNYAINTTSTTVSGGTANYNGNVITVSNVTGNVTVTVVMKLMACSVCGSTAHTTPTACSYCGYATCYPGSSHHVRHSTSCTYYSCTVNGSTCGVTGGHTYYKKCFDCEKKIGSGCSYGGYSDAYECNYCGSCTHKGSHGSYTVYTCGCGITSGSGCYRVEKTHAKWDCGVHCKGITTGTHTRCKYCREFTCMGDHSACRPPVT